MKPEAIDGLIIRDGSLSINDVGKWSFEDEKIVFIAADGTYSAFERPEGFTTTIVRIFHHRKNVVGFEGDGAPVWLFAHDGRISQVDEIISDRNAFGPDEPIFERFCPHDEDLVFLSEIGGYLFRDGELAWSVRFQEHGGWLDFERRDYLTFTRRGLLFFTTKGGRKLCLWRNGHVE